MLNRVLFFNFQSEKLFPMLNGVFGIFLGGGLASVCFTLIKMHGFL